MSVAVGGRYFTEKIMASSHWDAKDEGGQAIGGLPFACRVFSCPYCIAKSVGGDFHRLRGIVAKWRLPMNGNPPIIRRLRALEVLDSRGNPTVEAMALLDNGVLCAFCRAFRGVDRFAGGGGETRRRTAVLAARGCVRRFRMSMAGLREAVVGQPVDAQEQVDSLLNDLDGSGNKSSLGANAILAVSMAVKKAAAQAAGRPLYRTFGDERAAVLPIPLMNILNGGGARFQCAGYSGVYGGAAWL